MKKPNNIIVKMLMTVSRTFVVWLQDIVEDMNDDNISAEEKTRLVGGLGGMIGMTISTVWNLILSIVALIAVFTPISSEQEKLLNELKSLIHALHQKQDVNAIEQQRGRENE